MKLKDFLNSINYDKKPLLDGEDKAEKFYTPFVINKCMSFFQDTIFHANEINCRHWMDRKMQFDYYRTAVRKKKRFSPWLKKETEENIDLIKQAFGYTDIKAQQVLNILDPNDLEKLKQSLYLGGTNDQG